MAQRWALLLVGLLVFIGLAVPTWADVRWVKVAVDGMA